MGHVRICFGEIQRGKYLVFSVQSYDTGFVCAYDGLACFDYAGGCFNLVEIRFDTGDLGFFYLLEVYLL